MRFALGLEYDGAAFHGWQRQPLCDSVQGALESALATVAGEPITAVAAGRTDRGVHAEGQVAHFDTTAHRPLQAWVRGTNAAASPSLAVLWAHPVSADFHARFSAHCRRYRYVLVNRAVRPALGRDQLGWYHRPLDLGRLREAARWLIGQHDFSSFRAAECQAKTPCKTMYRVDIEQYGDHFHFHFEADAFLQHMVRNLIGALVRVGSGQAKPDWIAELLDARDRTRGAPTFSAAGLCLTGVGYAPHWGLPESDSRAGTSDATTLTPAVARC